MPAGPGVSAPEAGLARRLGALVYEVLIVAAIVLVAGFALSPLVSPSAAPSGPLVLPAGPGRAVGALGVVAVLGAYFAWCWTGGRRTLPMKTWRLAIVDSSGSPPGAARALARYAAGWIGPGLAVAVVAATGSRLGWIALSTGYAWALVDPGRRFLHDRLAGTSLVRRD